MDRQPLVADLPIVVGVTAVALVSLCRTLFIEFSVVGTHHLGAVLSGAQCQIARCQISRDSLAVLLARLLTLAAAVTLCTHTDNISNLDMGHLASYFGGNSDNLVPDDLGPHRLAPSSRHGVQVRGALWRGQYKALP